MQNPGLIPIIPLLIIRGGYENIYWNPVLVVHERARERNNQSLGIKIPIISEKNYLKGHDLYKTIEKYSRIRIDEIFGIKDIDFSSYAKKRRNLLYFPDTKKAYITNVCTIQEEIYQNLINYDFIYSAVWLSDTAIRVNGKTIILDPISDFILNHNLYL